MEIIDLEQKKMEVLKELADTNIKISENKNIISKLQEEETEYLILREKKAVQQINQVLLDSKDLLEQTKENYEEVHIFCQTITEYSKSLKEAHTKFDKMLSDFREKDKEWEEEVKKQREEIEKIKQAIEIEKTTIKNDKKYIEKANENIKKETLHIESKQRQLKIALQEINK
jgi:hypothetical protein